MCAFFMWAKDFLYHIAPDVCGVFLGGMIIQWYWTRRSNESAIIDHFMLQLNRIVDEAVEYWSLDCRIDAPDMDENRRKAKILEGCLKRSALLLSSELRQYANRYWIKPSFDSKMQDIHDACTGGSFESINRGPEKSRYISVISATQKVRWALLSRKF